MKNFLIDKNKIYTYESLLENINNSSSYCQIYKTDVLYDFFLNFIISLLSESPIVLIDSDINENELQEINTTRINICEKVSLKKYIDFNEIVNDILKSKSEVTIFTSGTTGQPKKVIHSVQTLSRSIRISDKHQNNIWGFAYNPTHMAGIQVFLQSFFNNNTIVNLFGSSRNYIYILINNYSISHISATPTFYRLLLPIENLCSSVQRITFGGEKSDNKLYNSIIQIFPNAKINNIYASTEAGSLFSAKGEYFQIPQNIIDRIKVENEELLIHKSLLGKSDSFIFSGEFYCTGDLIEWINKEEGLFRFNSKKNELINIGGYKVNPTEIESVILDIPDVIQVMVYGKPNSVLGNILCADVKLLPLSVLTESFLRNRLSNKLQDFKIPRRIKFVDTFSLTRTGKIKRI